MVDGEFTAALPFTAPTDSLIAFANVTYDSVIRISSRLEKRPVSELPSVKPTLERQTLIDAMDSPADWNWVPAYTDPNREDRFFAEWSGPNGERGFTLDPKTFNRAGPMTYYFGTRKIGDPQFCGVGRKLLLLDHWAAHPPEKLTVRLSVRKPGEPAREFSADLPPTVGDGVWKTWRMEPAQFKDATGASLKNWDQVQFFVLNGTNPANQPPVFKRLRWSEK